MIENKMINKKTWKEFYDSGMLWWINMILHTFGWAICYESEYDGTILDVYPIRMKFRGFPQKVNTDGYIKVSKYLKDNIDELVEEAMN